MAQELYPIRENDRIFIELVIREVKKVDPHALFDINYLPSNVTVKIQSNESLRGKIFNKLYHIHKLYDLPFKPTQFIKRDKTIISFDLEGKFRFE